VNLSVSIEEANRWPQVAWLLNKGRRADHLEAAQGRPDRTNTWDMISENLM
jgi:hypothetical protein